MSKVLPTLTSVCTYSCTHLDGIWHAWKMAWISLTWASKTTQGAAIAKVFAASSLGFRNGGRTNGITFWGTAFRMTSQMFVLLGLLGILSGVNSAFCCMYHRTPHPRIIFPTTTSLSNQTTIGSSMWRLFMLAKGCFKDQSLRLLRRADFTSLHHDPDWRLAIWAPDQQMTGLNPLCYVSRNVHWKLSARSAGVQMPMGFNFGKGMACPLRNVLVFACFGPYFHFRKDT